MLIRNQTIVALATPLGYAPLALIRVSGTEAVSKTDKIFKGSQSLNEVSGNTIVFGYIVNPATNESIDQVLVSVFKTPKSFTGEDMVEITCHGGFILFQKILDLFIENGCSLAEPGEFSKRAFFNQKMDLTQAESIHDLIFSRSFKVSQLLLSTLKKNFGKKLKGIKQNILDVIAQIEVNIDYSEEDLEEFSLKDIVKLKQSREKVEILIQQGNQSRLLNNGYKVALIGKTNAGKSSLLNTLVGEDKAIVSSIEGTTRDPIEVTLSINDIAVTFIDTAGLRKKTDNEIELLGIQKTKEIAMMADLIVFVQDVTDKNDSEILPLILEVEKNKTPYLLLYNKIDLLPLIDKTDVPTENTFYFSCMSKQGYQELVVFIEKSLKEISPVDTYFYINQRQNSLLENLLEILKETDSLMHTPDFNELELVSLLLQKALDIIGDIDGSSSKEEILETIFSQFCIGK